MKLFKLWTLALLALMGVQNYAQEDNYMDLLVLYVDGDYEKCLHKADKYMEKDETKKDALPYLYTSMSFYEMSRDHQYSETYPNAYRECLNYLSKYRKKDKAYVYRKDAEPFVEKVKFELAELIENYELSGTEKDYRKSKSLLKKVVKIDPDDTGAQLMLGVHYIYAKDKSTGKQEIKEALEKLEGYQEDLPFDEMTASQQYFLKEGLIAFYGYKSDYYPEEAKEVLLLGKKYFNPEREDLLIENYKDYLKLLNEVES